MSTYILAQVHDQLKACGPDTWAGQFLDLVAPGYSAAPTTHLVTSWESVTVTRTDGKETIFSSAVLTRAVTEKFWVQEVQVATSTVERTITASMVESVAPAGPFGTPGSSQSENGTSSSSTSTPTSNSNTGIIAGCVIGGVALWVLSIFAAIWLYKRRKRRKTGPKFDEDGANNLEKERVVKINTLREKAEMGGGDIYEIGIHEAFELDATETERQGKTGRFDEDDTKKERPGSSETHKTAKATIEIEGGGEGEDKAEQKALGKGADTRLPSG